MIYGSVCSGIEAATVACHPLGWQAAWYSEIEPFPCAVLQHHYPSTPNLGDMTRLHERPEIRRGAVDLLVGGTPCQSFSVAGLRKGLADPRGNLALVFLALLDLLRPEWMVWENVPGVLSSWSDATDRPAAAADYAVAGLPDPGDGRRGRVAEQTNDFDTFLCGLRELGYAGAWRVLDAQFFGVPQRRRRVFVVGHLGDGAPARAVLFERHSLSGNPPPSRRAGQGTAGDAQGGAGGGGGVARALCARANSSHREDSDNFVAHALRADGFDASEDGTGRGTPLVPVESQDVAGTLSANHGNIRAEDAWGGKPLGFEVGPQGGDIVDTAPTLDARCKDGPVRNQLGAGVFGFQSTQDATQHDEVSPTITDSRGGSPAVAYGLRTEASGANGTTATGKVSKSLDTGSPPAVCFESRVARNGRGSPVVRRLTPRECERLQGFPDDYTLVPTYRSKLDKDDVERVAAYLGIPLAEARDLGATPDGPRYKALGNSMAVPVVRWIGARIVAVEEAIRGQR